MTFRALRSAFFAGVIALSLAGCAATSAYDDEPQPEPTYDQGDDYDYYDGAYFDAMAPYGTWVQVADYGWAWCPFDTPVGWRPFTVGYWVWSDWGWLWISEDPWGGTPYHYGRWAYDRDYGWVWVPGDVWAPAWVAWRYGPGWVGWAALPPTVDWRSGVGLSYSTYELDQRINRRRWCFTSANDFGTTRTRVTVEPSSRNVTLITSTKNVTKYVAGPSPVDESLPPSAILEVRGRTFERYRVVNSPKPDGGTVDPSDRTVHVFRPKGSVTQIVRQRVKNVPPVARPIPSRRMAERVQAEKARLDEAVRQQRDDLNKQHEREMNDRPPGVSVQDLKRRQDAELKEQKQEEARQKQEIEAREKAVEKARTVLNEKRGFGRGRGRGQEEQNDQAAQPDTLEKPTRERPQTPASPRGRGRGR